MNSSGKFARRRGGKRTGKEYKLNTYEIQSFFYSLLHSSIVIVAVEDEIRAERIGSSLTGFQILSFGIFLGSYDYDSIFFIDRVI